MRTPDGIMIVRVLPEDFNSFRIFDPYDCLDLCVLPGSYALGALDDGSGEKENRPVGLFVATVTGEALVIEWMATDPDFRNLGVGDAFLEAAITAAEGLGLSEVQARIREDVKSAAEYFDYCQFDVKKPDKGEYRLTFPEAVTYGKIPRDGDPEYIKPVKDLSPNEISALNDYLENSKHVHSLAPGIKCSSYIDPSLSCVWMEDGEMGGALLFVSSGHNHYPVLIDGKTAYETKGLISFVADKVKKSKLLDDLLIIRMNSSYIQSMVKSIIGDVGYTKALRLSMGVDI
jgi:GNAT superfamily N-acetyltransferase